MCFADGHSTQRRRFASKIEIHIWFEPNDERKKRHFKRRWMKERENTRRGSKLLISFTLFQFFACERFHFFVQQHSQRLAVTCVDPLILFGAITAQSSRRAEEEKRRDSEWVNQKATRDNAYRNRFGPLRGDDSHICSFGVCLLMTKLPLPPPIWMVNTPLAKDTSLSWKEVTSPLQLYERKRERERERERLESVCVSILLPRYSPWSLRKNPTNLPVSRQQWCDNRTPWLSTDSMIEQKEMRG